MKKHHTQKVNIPLREKEEGFHLARTVGLRRAGALLTAIRQTAKAAKRGKSSDRRRRVFRGMGGRRNGFFRKLFAPALTQSEQMARGTRDNRGAFPISFGGRGRNAVSYSRTIRQGSTHCRYPVLGAILQGLGQNRLVSCPSRPILKIRP